MLKTYLLVCIHVWVHVCKCVCIEVNTCRGLKKLSTILFDHNVPIPLPEPEAWIWACVFADKLNAIMPLRSYCLCSLWTKVTGMHGTLGLFMWVLGPHNSRPRSPFLKRGLHLQAGKSLYLAPPFFVYSPSRQYCLLICCRFYYYHQCCCYYYFASVRRLLLTRLCLAQARH